MTANTGASTSAKAKPDFMIYNAAWPFCFITEKELLALTCIIVLQWEVQASDFQTFHWNNTK